MNPFAFLSRLLAARAAERERTKRRMAALAARRAGDAARDRRDWAEAASQYDRYLALQPDDAALWVQLGHARKESGDLPAAELAYRAAQERQPRDHDIALQLGHALKLQGRLEEAAAAYALSDQLAPINHAAEELAALAGVEIRPRPAGVTARQISERERLALERLREAELDVARAPDNPAAHRALAEALLQSGRRNAAIAAAREAWRLMPERRNWQTIRRVGGTPPEEGTPGGPQLHDVTDLLTMVRDTGRATGIQRVQLGLAEGILADPAAAEEARFVFLAERFGPLWTLAREDIAAIIAYCLHEPHDPLRAEALVNGAMDRARPTHLPSARVFFIMGAFWFWAGVPSALARLRAAGLRIGLLVYDLIPLTHPEHTSEGTVAAFRQGLEEGAALWDFALTISEFTARELGRQLRAIEAPPIPIRPVPLAHRISPPDKPDAAAFPEAVRDLRGQDYVLCVGTIESRKNHLALFQAWQILLREGMDPPPLVLVGRPGWRVTDLMEQLEATGFLGGRVRLVHGVSDPELEGLYRGCLFTIFPSFTEGWGLPVGESLALGKLCLAALEGATPEAAGGFAEPIDAYSPRDIAARVRHFVTDRAALAAAEARLREGFTPRGWPEVTRHFLTELTACLAVPPPQRATPEAPRLAPGQRLLFTPGAALGDLLVLGAGFEPPEPPGAWLIGSSGTLTVECAAPMRLWLRLRAAPWATDNRAGIALGDGPLQWAEIEPGQEAMLALDVPAGHATLRLVVDGPTHPPPEGERRPIRVALSEITAVAHETPRLAPGRAVIFGPAAAAQDWLALLAEGWSQTANGQGVGVLAPMAVLRLAVPAEAVGEIRVLLHLHVRAGAHARLRHPGGLTALPEGGGALLLPLAVTTDAEGQARIALEMEDRSVPPIRLAALQWAAEADMAARLAMIESVMLPEGGAAHALSATRLTALEARLRAETAEPATPLPGGEAGRAALRLAASRKG
ncbi:glycosyltransferase [Roseococcus sp. SDR]|uniref:glycosyltransferase family 4 protein n=1 Tax=Roseococcus sp. SDR TaxID=2835532 RepID=UPI001BCF8F09|nr:glycosyltransferase family 1 protein [Roseococcus sp. SDR]MBS7789116.1 glycosyltransferase [Roseococcus sp. SDR]MBV1844430.1 glycosyltransferase [Roseococcus sp. SDR]